MTDITESNQVFRIIVRRIQVAVVDTETLRRAADDAGIAVTLKNGSPQIFPCRKAVF
jgi:hypothetical protein